jgi:hypothetical protein
MCGAVSFTSTEVPDHFGACHCEMCRRWTGSALLGLTVPQASVTWTGEENIETVQSSDWAERAWCGKCGSVLYYHVTLDGPMSANIEIPLGLLDDASGLEFKSEIYIDHKPEAFAYAGDRTRLTRKEVLAKYGIDEGDM